MIPSEAASENPSRAATIVEEEVVLMAGRAYCPVLALSSISRYLSGVAIGTRITPIGWLVMKVVGPFCRLAVDNGGEYVQV